MSNQSQRDGQVGGVLGTFDDIDRKISDKIAVLEFGILIECLIIIPTVMFSPVGIPLFIAFNIFYYRSFVFLVSMVLGLIFSEGIKKIAQRPRPELQGHKPLNITQYLMHVDSFSMPSGDTLQAAVFAVVCAQHLNLSQWMYVFIPWAAFGRVYWGNHWLGDTIVGALIGSTVTFIITANFEDLLQHSWF